MTARTRRATTRQEGGTGDAAARLPRAEARRLFLHAQGLLDDPARPATPASVQDLVQRLGFVQVDSIPYVERAHHLTLGARLDGYDPALLEQLLERDRSLFEHWTHDAAMIPTVWFPYWRPRFARAKRSIQSNSWWQERLGDRQSSLLRQVLSRVEREGALGSKDFEHARTRASEGWWDWKPQKAALEYLWHTGKLLITRRVEFHKLYDLAERVLPESTAAPTPTPAAQRDWACRTALERLGVATPGEIAAFWRSIDPPAAKTWCTQAARRGDIVAVQIDGDGRSYAAWTLADWPQRLAAVPEAPERMRLLGPFDPILHDRKRTQRLFGFDYAFEAFVPAARRRFGYYTMPILERDALVGRIDPKFHRDRDTLVVASVWWEPGIRPTRDRRRALTSACESLAQRIGAARLELPRR